MSEVIRQAIEDAAQAPKDVTSGAKRVTQHNLSDLIEADKYLTAKARSRTRNPLRVHQLSPPGTQ